MHAHPYAAPLRGSPDEPAAPSLTEAAAKAAKKLPTTQSGEKFSISGETNAEYEAGFETLGLGVTAYMALLKHWGELSLLCLLLPETCWRAP